MTWQVIDGMRYSMVDEGGPGGDSTRAGKEEEGQTAINITSSAATFTDPAHLTVTPRTIAAVRGALHGWGVTTVVIPDKPGLPPLERVPSVTTAAALITAATGQLPVYQKGSWVWTEVNHASPSVVTTSSKFAECTRAGSRGTAAVEAATACIASKGLFVKIVTSVNGTDLLRNRLLMAMAADTVAVTKVEFVITGKGISDALTVPAHRFVDGSLTGWLANSEGLSLPNGSYTLASVAHNAAGMVDRSSDVTMNVDDQVSPFAPPVTRMVKPALHAQLSGTTYLVATASSKLGLRNVEFRITGNGRTVTERAAPFLYGWFAGWNTKSVPSGTYDVSSVAEGNSGLVTTSKAVIVNVRN
jgi:hypothetical protein